MLAHWIMYNIHFRAEVHDLFQFFPRPVNIFDVRVSSRFKYIVCNLPFLCLFFFYISVPALGKHSDPAIVALKFAHNVICLRSDKFQGDIQDILDSSALFKLQDDTLVNLRIDCIYFI